MKTELIKYIKNICAFTFNCMINLLIFYLVLFLIGSILLSSEQVVNFFYFNNFKIASNSMEKHLKQNDIIIARKILEKEYSKLKPSSSIDAMDGDIVIFKIDSSQHESIKDRLIIHRIVENNVKEKYITTKGDNNSDIADWERKIPYERILAKKIIKIDSQNVLFLQFILTIILYFLFIVLINKIYDKKNNNK
jgi:signal peptidase I